MPRIPSGLVEPSIPVAVAERPVLGLPPLPPEPAEPHWCLNTDGTIDNTAETNRVAKDVAMLLDMEMDVADPVFCAGIVVLLGNPLRFRAADIAGFAGLPQQFCKLACQNLVRSRLVVNGNLAGPIVASMNRSVSDADNDVVALEFVLYCLVGAGQIRCERRIGEPEPYWSAIPDALKCKYEIARVA